MKSTKLIGHSGVLSLELGAEKFERTGMQGVPIRSGGRKHKKERYRKRLRVLNIYLYPFSDV